MAKFEVMTWYSCTEYGKCYQIVDADSKEEAIEKAHEEGHWEDYKCKGQDDFEFSYEESEANNLTEEGYCD